MLHWILMISRSNLLEESNHFHFLISSLRRFLWICSIYLYILLYLNYLCLKLVVNIGVLYVTHMILYIHFRVLIININYTLLFNLIWLGIFCYILTNRYLSLVIYQFLHIFSESARNVISIFNLWNLKVYLLIGVKCVNKLLFYISLLIYTITVYFA